jgi:hypothetical protein
MMEETLNFMARSISTFDLDFVAKEIVKQYICEMWLKTDVSQTRQRFKSTDPKLTPNVV